MKKWYQNESDLIQDRPSPFIAGFGVAWQFFFFYYMAMFVSYWFILGMIYLMFQFGILLLFDKGNF
jgi:hypothetical protein